MKKITLIPLIGLFLLPLTTFADVSIVGKWRNIDDQTGFSKGIIEIYKEQDGTYAGKIYEINARPGYIPQEYCYKCSGEKRNKPIVGMTVIWNFVNTPEKPLHFDKGTILDPSSGKVYRGKLRLSENGKRLNLKGFIGIEMLGRNQTWLRVDN